MADESETLDMKSLKDLFVAQTKMLEKMMKKDDSSFSFDAVEARMHEFKYSPEEDSTFELWWNRHEDIFDVDMEDYDDVKKIRLLLRHMHPTVEKTFLDSIVPIKWSEMKLKDVVEKMTTLFGDQTSLFEKRRRMFDFRMSSEGIDDPRVLAARVNRLVQSAQPAKIELEQMKCLVFLHALDVPRYSDVHMLMLKEAQNGKDVTLDKLIEVYNRSNQLKNDSRAITEANGNVNAVNTPKKGGKQITEDKFTCYRCGDSHHSDKCRFKNTTCHTCGKVGHIAKVCRGGSRKHPKGKKIKMIKVNTIGTDHYTISVRMQNKSIAMQIDTGADITLISEDVWKQIGAPDCSKANCQPVCANGSKLEIKGRFRATVEYGGISKEGDIYVTSSDIVLLGKDFLKKLKVLVVRDDALPPAVKKVTSQLTKSIDYSKWIDTEFPETTQSGLGACTKTKATLKVKEGARPVFIKARQVPYALTNAVEEELKRLEDMGAIKKVDYSEWAAPILVVPKPNGSIRMCADFSTGLNDSIELPTQPLPLPEDIYASLNGCTVFSQIDLADAYLQVELDDTAKKLLVINTHKGLFQYQRLPFGVKAAPGIFQKLMDTMLTGIQNAVPYLDDIIIGGKTKEDHDATLFRVFTRIKEYGLKTRTAKCSFGLEQVKFLGFLIDKNGRHTDPKKTEAITTMPEPENQAMLRSFLGMVTYYGQYIEGMHKLRAPLDHLLKKDTKWKWSDACRESFRELKRILSSQLSLTHYDPKKEIVVAADACETGIGAVIMHRFADGTLRAVAHASRTLKPAERNYGQIDKEALALVYAVTKFHKYIYGRRFTLHTDHQPLLAIFGKRKGDHAYTAKRIYRWAQIMLMYDYRIEYIRTESFAYADSLSRLINTSKVDVDDDITVSLIQVEEDEIASFQSCMRSLPLTSSDIRKETEKDSLLKEVAHYHKRGWPTKIVKKKPILIPFEQRKDDLSIVEGCLLYRSRVIVPDTLKKKVLKELHEGHPGIVRMKALSRSVCYWPRIDQDIETLVKSCERCASAAKCPTKVPLQPWYSAERPWQRVHIDYAGPVRGDYFLVVVDAYSKWPEIFVTNRMTAQVTVDLMSDLVARHGIPEVIVSDNGTQFTSDLFSSFCSSNGIKHMTIAPYHPQSNGQAERFVDTLKRSLKKMDGEKPTKEVVRTFLLHYRRNPNGSTPGKISPAEAFLGRNLRGRIDLLVPRSTENIQNADMKEQFDRRNGAVDRRFRIGDEVYYKKHTGPNQSEWVRGTILRRRGSVMFEISVGEKTQKVHKNQLRRNAGSSKDSHGKETPMHILIETFCVPKKANDDEVIIADDVAETTPTAATPTTASPPRPTTVPPRRSTTVSPPRSPTVHSPAPRRASLTRPPQQQQRSPLRRSSRTRNAPKKLEVDPKKKTYH